MGRGRHWNSCRRGQLGIDLNRDFLVQAVPEEMEDGGNDIFNLEGGSLFIRGEWLHAPYPFQFSVSCTVIFRT